MIGTLQRQLRDDDKYPQSVLEGIKMRSLRDSEGTVAAWSDDNMLFMHVITLLLMQINALIITNICMLSSFKHISIILYKFML